MNWDYKTERQWQWTCDLLIKEVRYYMDKHKADQEFINIQDRWLKDAGDELYGEQKEHWQTWEEVLELREEIKALKAKLYWKDYFMLKNRNLIVNALSLWIGG